MNRWKWRCQHLHNTVILPLQHLTQAVFFIPFPSLSGQQVPDGQRYPSCYSCICMVNIRRFITSG